MIFTDIPDIISADLALIFPDFPDCLICGISVDLRLIRAFHIREIL